MKLKPQTWLRCGAPCLLMLLLVAGCESVGNAPSGPSEAEVRKEREAMPPEKQIKLIQRSPMPADEQKKQIDAIKEKYHLSGDYPAGGSAPAAPGAPQQPSPAGN